MKTVPISFEYAGQPVLMHGFAGDHIAKSIMNSGDFYESEMLTHIADLQPTGTIVDVGANIGNHTVFFGMFTDADKVIAVEPNELVVPLLERNIAVNHLSNKVVRHSCALGAEPGRVGLLVGRLHNLGHTRTIAGSDVEQRRLDDIVSDKEISVIKIDVEGYELEVLKGASRVLREQKPELFLEAATIRRRRILDDFLRGFGYRSGAVFNRTPTYQYSKVTLKKRLGAMLAKTSTLQ